MKTVHLNFATHHFRRLSGLSLKATLNYSKKQVFSFRNWNVKFSVIENKYKEFEIANEIDCLIIFRALSHTSKMQNSTLQTIKVLLPCRNTSKKYSPGSTFSGGLSLRDDSLSICSRRLLSYSEMGHPPKFFKISGVQL